MREQKRNKDVKYGKNWIRNDLKRILLPSSDHMANIFMRLSTCRYIKFRHAKEN